MSETRKAPYDEGFTEIADNVFVGQGEVVVIGTPWDGEDENDPAAHNCDAMGCGQWHVLHRAPLIAPVPAAPAPEAAGETDATNFALALDVEDAALWIAARATSRVDGQKVIAALHRVAGWLRGVRDGATQDVRWLIRHDPTCHAIATLVRQESADEVDRLRAALAAAETEHNALRNQVERTRRAWEAERAEKDARIADAETRAADRDCHQ